MATKPRAKMVQRDATLDDLLKSGTRYQQFAEDHPEQAPAPEPSGAMRRVLGDGGIALMKGAIGVPEAAVGLADLATGGAAGKMLENEGGAIGFRPKMAKQFLDTYKSPEQQAADKAVQEAQGFVDTTVAALKNPSVVLGSVAESVPMMLGGGVIARSLLRMAPASLAAGTAAPVVAGAAGEGIVAAGSGAESIRQETPDGLLTGEQASLAAASGLATGFLGYLGGKVAQRLGINDIDTVLAGKAGPEVTKGFTRRVLEGAVAEGLLEELPQSVQGQVAQNMALGKPLGEGVTQAAVLGALAGGLMGGGGNAISYGGQVRREKVDGGGPASKAINAGMEDTAKQADAIEAAAVPPVVDPLAAAGAALTEMQEPVDPLSMGAIPAEAVPVDQAAARAQREADRPAPPAAQPEPGEQVLTSMDNAMRAQQRAGDGAEIMPVAGGLVVRKVDAETGEIAPIAPDLPGVEPAPPAPPDPDPLPGDVLAAGGKPWPERAMAVRTMKQKGDGWTIAKVNGGFAVRQVAAPVAPAPAPTETTTEAPHIDAAAHQAASSPLNDRPEPTDAQKAAGNYVKGHVRLSGMDVSIETPKGAERRSKADAAEPWKVTMPAHYGYIKRTMGADGDHVDLFIGDRGDNGRFWVINQHHAGQPGKFDEHKVVTGVDSADEAVQVYKASFADGFGDKVFTSISAEHGADSLKALLPRLEKARPVKAAPAAAPTTHADPEPSAKKQLKNAGSSANTPMAPPAPAAGSDFTPENWWSVALPPEREPMLLAAGWKPGSPGLDAMKGKRWDEFTPSQKARVEQAINAKKAAADEATRPQAQAAGAEANPPAAAPTPAPAAAGTRPAGVEADGLKPEAWWEKSLTPAGRHKAMLAAGMAKGDKPTYPDAIRWQYLPLTAQARLRELQASGWDADKVGEPGNAAPAPAAPDRWETFVMRQSPRAGELFVSQPSPQHDSGFENLASFKVRADGKAGRINQYHSAADTVRMVEQAVARWSGQQAPAAPEGAREKRERLIAERAALAQPEPDAELKAAGFTSAPSMPYSWSKSVLADEGMVKHLFGIRVIGNAGPKTFRVTRSTSFPGTGITGAPTAELGTFDTAAKALAEVDAEVARRAAARAGQPAPAPARGPTVIINRLGKDGLTDAERAAGKAPYSDPPAAGPKVSDQLRSYANAIRDGKGTPGMLDQIAADERLLDGEDESLFKLAAEYKVPGARERLNRAAAPSAPAPAPKPDKAEIRPYRRADGSIGYEAVPIIPPSPPPAAVATPAPAPAATKPERPAELIELRKRLSVLQSLKECLA